MNKKQKLDMLIKRLKKSKMPEVYLYNGEGPFNGCIAYVEMRDTDEDGNEVWDDQSEDLVNSLIKECELKVAGRAEIEGSDYSSICIGVI